MRERRGQAGQWLQAARKTRGMSAMDLAAAIGVTRQTISAYELGKNGVGDEMASKIARVLGLGEIETRRGLGLYVPGDAAEDAPPRTDVLGSIRNDPYLIPEARAHLMRQYELLRRLGDGSLPEDDLKDERARQEADVQERGAAMLDEVASRPDDERSRQSRSGHPK